MVKAKFPLNPADALSRLSSVFLPTKRSNKLFKFLEQSGKDCLRGCMSMLLVQAIDDFFNGYFSTHERSTKTKVAYRSDLDQVAEYTSQDFSLNSLTPSFIEDWAAHLRLK